MYIKSLILKGFKSYNEQIELGPFHPGHNVIVGRNGSGKSNLFKAIAFVLSDEYSKLGPSQRPALLYNEGQTEASVEIVFDNTGTRRFPIDSDEVRIRRYIGIKKDDFFLDSKHVTKSDITNLLETAGFSKSNPYNIVQQGKIVELSDMKDSSRLELLKELAGAQVYDERRKESFKILEESDEKLEQVSQMLEFIETRLKELEGEKDELKEYLELDKQRRTLEYTIYKKSLDNKQTQHANIEKEREKVKKDLNDKHTQLLTDESEKKRVSEAIKEIQQNLTLKKDELEAQRSQLLSISKQKSEVELDVEEFNRNSQRSEKKKLELIAKKEEMNATVKQLAKQIEEIKPRIQQLQKEEQALNESRRNCTNELETLYAKQGRQQQFSSKKERDAWLQTQIKEFQSEIEATKQQGQKLQSLLKSKQDEIARNKEEIKQKESEIAMFTKRENAVIVEIGSATERLSKQRDEHVKFGKKLKEAETGSKNAETAVAKSNSELLCSLPHDISKGLMFLNSLPSDKKHGVFGPLIDLFTCEEAFFTALQTIGGNQLFSIVVDSHKTAINLIKLMQGGNNGRLTFMPLDKLRPKNVHLPTDDSAIPLISRLQFDGKFENAIRQVFGRCLVCRDNDTAKRYQVEYKVDCVTLDGDLTNRRGAITGGYVNPEKGRLRLQASIVNSKQKLAQMESDLASAQVQKNQIEQSMTAIESQIQKLKMDKEQLLTDNKLLQSGLSILREKNEQLEGDVDALVDSVRHCEQKLMDLNGKVESMKKETKEELVRTLSEAERNRMLELTGKDTSLKREYEQIVAKISDSKGALSEYESKLQSLLSEQEKLERDLNSTTTLARAELEQKQSQLNMLTAKMAEYTKNIKLLEQSESEENSALNEHKSVLETMKKKLDVANKEAQELSSRATRLHDQVSVISQEQQDLREKLRSLGSLPESALQESTHKLSSLKDDLVKVNERLKQFGHINKKAMDQFTTFTQQRDEYEKKEASMLKNAEAIRDLIASLDMKKDETIYNTFQLVAKNFATVFKEIVPKGKGSLVMKVPTGAAKDLPPGKREYSGIGIKVCFDGKNEVTSMTSLSGGQRTVVALALIFAIQRNDPAPFYLFDEVDANLDPIYRSAIADMIRRQAADSSGEGIKAQFVSTTFQRELVEKSSKVWFVSMANKQSTVNEITREEALSIIADAHQK